MPIDVVMNQRRGTKRRNVDVDGNDLPDAKRNKAPVDGVTKMKTLLCILHLHEFMLTVFKGARTNIDDMANLTSFIMTIHNKLRQEANGVGSMRAKIQDNTEFEAGEATSKFSDLKGPFITIMKKYGFEYKKEQPFLGRMGTFKGIFSLICAYRYRFNEMRNGTHKIVLRKTAEADLEMPISIFGLRPIHAVTLKGCTYNPSLQSSIKQSLGPMTIAINLAMTTDVRFQGGWKTAFCGAFKNINMAPQIANLIAGTQMANRTVLGHLADLALFGIARTSNKAFLPISFFLGILPAKCPTYKALIDGLTPLTVATVELKEDMLTEEIKNLDFSGHGLLGFWNSTAASGVGFTINGSDNLTATVASESVFHSVFGTYTEDLGYLKWLTNHEFMTRRQMGGAFQQRGSRSTTPAVTMYNFLRFSKLASAALSKTITAGTGQEAPMCVFSGNRRIDVDLEGAWIQCLKIVQGPAANYSGEVNLETIIALLQDAKNTIRNEITRERAIVFGTTEHFKYDAEKKGADYGAKENERPVMSGVYFYGNNN